MLLIFLGFDRQQLLKKRSTVMIPHKTYIHHIPAFVNLVCFTAKLYCAQIIHGIILCPVL